MATYLAALVAEQLPTIIARDARNVSDLEQFHARETENVERVLRILLDPEGATFENLWTISHDEPPLLREIMP